MAIRDPDKRGMNNGMNPPALYDQQKIDYNFGLAIRMLRKEKGLTQDYVAAIVGASTQWIGRMERGEGVPRLHDVIGVCNALDVNADELFKACEKRTNFAWVGDDDEDEE